MPGPVGSLPQPTPRSSPAIPAQPLARPDLACSPRSACSSPQNAPEPTPPPAQRPAPPLAQPRRPSAPLSAPGRVAARRCTSDTVAPVVSTFPFLPLARFPLCFAPLEHLTALWALPPESDLREPTCRNPPHRTSHAHPGIPISPALISDRERTQSSAQLPRLDFR